MSEFDLIDLIQSLMPVAASGVEAGIGDDAAILSCPAGKSLVATVDTLIEGVHFPVGTAAGDIGYKSLAVNLSDLAAMGALPAWCLLSLSMPREDTRWVEDFARGFGALAKAHHIALVGGDTCAGPLSVSVTALGLVDPCCALRRDGAVPGDLVCVSGRLGDAALALKQLKHGRNSPLGVAMALARPTPRIELGTRLVGLATACIDLSDGLMADLGHVVHASGCGAEINLGLLPASDELKNLGDSERWDLQLAGGDDYELCFTVPSEKRRDVISLGHELGVDVAVIGTVQVQSGVACICPDGSAYAPIDTGYEHFSDRRPGDRHE